MSVLGNIEDPLDRLVGRKGRKILEQIGHFFLGALAGCIPAGIVLYVNSIDTVDTNYVIGVYIISGVLGGIAFATWREWKQNRGDQADESTLFHIGRLPINRDLVVDWFITASGGAVPGVGFYFV